MKKDNEMTLVKDYAITTIAVIIVAFGIQYFYAPNEIAGGGLSGLALVISHYIPGFSVGTIIFLGNLILFAISFILVGRDFGAKTIYASVMLSVVMDFMEKVIGTFAITDNLLLASILGTLVCAAGLTLAFAINASTGGTDIVAKILNKYTTFNIGISLLIVDLFVVLSGGITFGLDKGIYSLLCVVMNGLLIDRMIEKVGKKLKKEEKEKDKIAA